MKLKNKLIPILTAAALSTAITPMIAGCSCTKQNYLPTPGWETDYQEAHDRISSWSKTTQSGRLIRNNLAKQAQIVLSTNLLSLDGTAVTTHHEKEAGGEWIPVTTLTPIQFTTVNELEIPMELENTRAAYSAVDILTLDEKSITSESPTYDRMCDYVFNPFLYKATFEDLHKLASYNPSVFKETFTTTGSDNIYVTYEITDIAALLATKQIKELLESDTACFIPFRGTGSVKLSLGFNYHGYMIFGSITANSDYLEIYASPTSGKYPLRPSYYGKAYGTINYEADVDYFRVPRISVNLDGEGMADPQDRDPRAPTAPEWVNPAEWEFLEGIEYYVSFKNQSYKILPGYGATVVIQGPASWSVKDFSFVANGIAYTYEDIGPAGTGDVVMVQYSNDHEPEIYKRPNTYVFYLKPGALGLCGDGLKNFFINITSN